jgi:hypothetical protein
VLLLALAAQAAPPPLPPVVASLPQPTRALGEGTLRWFGLHVYDATLWAGAEAWSADAPFALDIRYARRVAGARLAAASVEEMRRLGYGSEQQLQRWGREMSRLFPDVEPGDRLIGVNLPGRGAAFYSARGPLGTVPDPAFARAFFAIWLDPRTREPGLRSALLGGGPARP